MKGLQLIGLNGMLIDKLKLKCSFTHRRKYQRGHSDLFILVEQCSLPVLRAIQIQFYSRPNVSPNLKALAPGPRDSLGARHRRLLYRFPYASWIRAAEGERKIVEIAADEQPMQVVPEEFQYLI